MNLQELLKKEAASIVITGDSLSYNRHGYDPKGRPNAYDCGVGIPSWSFSLRDRLLSLDPAFVTADQIEVDVPYVEGLANESPVPHTAAFGGKVKTLFPKEGASFPVHVSGKHIVLYLQQRIDAPCVTDIYVDGVLAAKDVDTKGSSDFHAGYGLMTVLLPCSVSEQPHTVEFRNLRGSRKVITLAAVGERMLSVNLSGKGGECVDYFLEHFEERIGCFSPDLLILSLGANDRGYRTVEEMKAALCALYGKLFTRFPDCQVLFLLPPPSHDPLAPEQSISPYCALSVCETFNQAIEEVSLSFGRNGEHPLPAHSIELLWMDRLFDASRVSEWRWDNIHMNPHGNALLLDAVCKRLGLFQTTI